MAVYFCSDEILFRRISWTKLVNSQSCYTKNTQQFCHITGSYKKYWACHVLNSTRPLQKGSHWQTLTRDTNLHDTFLVYFKMAKYYNQTYGKSFGASMKISLILHFLKLQRNCKLTNFIKYTKVLLMYYTAVRQRTSTHFKTRCKLSSTIRQ